MKKFVPSLVLWMLSTVALAQSTSRQEQFILDLSKIKFDWLVGKNYDSLTVLLDDKVQYIHSSGWVQNKREVLDDLRSGKLTYQKVIIKESTARLYNTTAIVTGVGTIDGVTEGKAFSVDLRYTEVYVKSENRWKLASRHANKMP